MKTFEKFLANVFIALIITLFTILTFAQNASAEPTAEEILAESKAAMSQPLKYHQIVGNVETVVYQKPLPDGSLAMLMDMSKPIKKINIIYGDKSYELYLDHRVAIDTQFMFQAAKSQATSAASLLGNKTAESSKLVGTIQRDGKDCYEIESILTSNTLAALAEVAPPGAKDIIPAKYRYVIDKDTHLMVEKETILKDGFSLSKVEFKNIQPQPGLSDEFFQIPAGIEIQNPKTVGEYTELVGDILSPDTTIKALEKKLSEIKKRKPHLRKPPEPPSREDLRKEVEALFKSRMAKVDKHTEKIQPKPESATRKIVLVASSVLLVVFIIVLVLHRFKKAK